MTPPHPGPFPRRAGPPPGVLVVFDLMGTLLHDPYRTAYARAAGCTFEEFQRARSPEVYDRFERGHIDEDAYWGSLRAHGVDVDVPTFHRLRRAGYRWLGGMRALLRDCAAAHPTVIGSNYPVWIADAMRLIPEEPAVDVFASCHLAVRKPDARFFEAVARATGRTVPDLVLVDDKEENVRALLAMGGRAVHHTSSRSTRQSLVDDGLLPAAPRRGPVLGRPAP